MGDGTPLETGRRRALRVRLPLLPLLVPVTDRSRYRLPTPGRRVRLPPGTLDRLRGRLKVGRRALNPWMLVRSQPPDLGSLQCPVTQRVWRPVCHAGEMGSSPIQGADTHGTQTGKAARLKPWRCLWVRLPPVRLSRFPSGRASALSGFITLTGQVQHLGPGFKWPSTQTRQSGQVESLVIVCGFDSHLGHSCPDGERDITPCF